MKIPVGWPTEEMVDAGWKAFWNRYCSGGNPRGGLALEEAFQAMLAAAPTPPAQDEPVAFVDKRGDFWSIDRAKEELADGNTLDLNPVYTRPTDDKLRKAAEEALGALRHLSQQCLTTDASRARGRGAIESLRTALEGK